MTIDLRPFGTTHDGRPVVAIDIDNSVLRGSLINYGARLVSLYVPDRDGRSADVVLGHRNLSGYENGSAYLGATCGRYGNRISGGRFTLDGIDYQLDVNEPPNTLQGGSRGFDRLVWAVAIDESTDSVRFSIDSPSGDQGFPGALTAVTTYRFDGPALRMTMEATTDAPTVVNLVHHSYWNLAGHDGGTIHDHELTIHASAYTPVDDESIPTGEIRPVEGTRFDFRTPRRLGDGIEIDHNWVLDGPRGQIRPVAVLDHRGSGRTLTLATTAPGLQCYTGARLADEPVGKSGGRYPAHGGVALESQRWPDSPNLAHFTDPWLRPGELYRHEMTVSFGHGRGG